MLLESGDHLVLHLTVLRLLFLQEIVLTHVLLLRDNPGFLDGALLFGRIRGVQVKGLVS